MSRKKSTSQKRTNSKPKNKKRTIIEPLIPEQENQEKFDMDVNEASAHLLNQEEFNRIIFPLIDVLGIFLDEFSSLMPELESEQLPEKIDQNKIEKNYHKALNNVIKRFTKEYVINKVTNVLFDIEDRLKDEPDDDLLISIYTLLYFMNKTDDSEKLGQSISDILKEGPKDEAIFDSIVDDFEEMHPGFSRSMFRGEEFDFDIDFDEDYDDDDLYYDLELIRSGVQNILNGDLDFDIFTKKEIEKGLALADAFYARLSENDKKKVERMDESFTGGKEFVDEIAAYLKEKLTPTRLKRIALKLEAYFDEEGYEKWDLFIEYLLFMIEVDEDTDLLFPILLSIYFSQLRKFGDQETYPSHKLFWFNKPIADYLKI